MSDIFIYDDTLNPISSTRIDIIENDSRGITVDIQANSSRGAGLYGAKLAVPSLAVPVGFWVDDLSGTYAPTGVEYFNPNASLRLEITLFPMPSPVGAGSTGSGPGSGPGGLPTPGSPSGDGDDEAFSDAELARLVNRLPWLAVTNRWSRREMLGVATLIATLTMTRARFYESEDPQFEERVQRWNGVLRRLIRVAERSGRGQGGGGSPVFEIPLRELGDDDFDFPVTRIPVPPPLVR
jgi:hypothetical protein